jgi:queuine tRNA-ribosyltransferase
VQGGQRAELRARCAEELIKLGFDGYGYGGYPIADGRLVDEVAMVAQLLPQGSVLHGLGIGTPENLVAAWRSGYSIFDCTLPTRNARRGVLYTDLNLAGVDLTDPDLADRDLADRDLADRDLADRDLADRDGIGRVSRIARLTDERWVRATGPVDASCDCELCRSYPAGYLAHLFRVEDTLAHSLATLHNLRFYTRLTAALRERAGSAAR